MRKMQTSITFGFLMLGALTLGFGASGKPGSGVTGNDLARELAAIARTTGATEAARALAETNLGARANAPLTEGGAATLLRAAGIAVSTSDPGRIVTRERADAVVRQFRAALVSVAGQRASTTAARGELPSGMEICVEAKNHGKCVECCKELGGSASTCTKSCMVINKPSASEPLP